MILDRFTPSMPCESFTYRAFSKIDAADVDALLRSTLASQQTIISKKRHPPSVDLTLLQRKRDAAIRRFKRTGDRTFLDEFL